MSGGVIALVVILAVLALLAVLAASPLSFYVKYVKGELYVDLRYLFFKKRLMPTKPKKQKNASQPPKEKPEKTAKKQKEPFFDVVERFFDLLSSGGGIARLAISFHRANIDLDVKVGGEDAADAAVQTGRLSAYFHTAAAALANFIKINKRRICVYPDYDCEDTEITFSGRFWSRPASYIFNIHKIVPLLLRLADALPPKKEEKNKGEKKQ